MAMLTKSQQTERYLRNAIISGRWAPGEALTPERQLLQELGVSRTTLRDALNSLANEGIIVRKSGSGTYVADVPTSKTVALVFNSDLLGSPMGYFYRRMSETARELVEDAGYRAVLAVGQGDTVEQFASTVNLFDKHVLKDTVGVISFTTMGPLERKLSEAGVSSVSIEHAVPTSQYCVVMDYAKMSALAVEALRAYGHYDFAHMTWELPDDPQRERKHRELRRLELDAVGGRLDRLIFVDQTRNGADAYLAFKEWWQRTDRPNAIFFSDDALCDVASRAILELGIAVPEDLAIITDLNVGRKIHFPVELTGVGWDPEKLVSEAWRMLRNLMLGQDVATPVVFVPPILRYGKSLGETGESDSLTSEAAQVEGSAFETKL